MPEPDVPNLFYLIILVVKTATRALSKLCFQSSEGIRWKKPVVIHTTDNNRTVAGIINTMIVIGCGILEQIPESKELLGTTTYIIQWIGFIFILKVGRFRNSVQDLTLLIIRPAAIGCRFLITVSSSISPQPTSVTYISPISPVAGLWSCIGFAAYGKDSANPVPKQTWNSSIRSWCIVKRITVDTTACVADRSWVFYRCKEFSICDLKDPTFSLALIIPSVSAVNNSSMAHCRNQSHHSWQHLRRKWAGFHRLQKASEPTPEIHTGWGIPFVL